jgi:hypothetical protein
MVAPPGAPDHRRIDRTRRSRSTGVDMLSTTTKRTIATTLSGVAIAGGIGAPAASAMPIDPVRATGQSSDVPIVPPPPPTPPPAFETAPNAGFDLSSAAIGAAAGTGLLIVVLAAGGLAWGRPIGRGHDPAGA